MKDRVPLKIPEGKHAWERLKGETSAAFNAFVVYRDMGADRSVAETARRLGKRRNYFGYLSSRFRWPERAAAYDRDVDEKIRDHDVKMKLKRRDEIRKLLTGNVFGSMRDNEIRIEKGMQMLSFSTVDVTIKKGDVGPDGKVLTGDMTIRAANPRYFVAGSKILHAGREGVRNDLYKELAETLPIPSAYSEDMREPSAIREAEIKRLQIMQDSWAERATYDAEAAVQYVRVSESLRKLIGLDAPPAAPVPQGNHKPSPKYITVEEIQRPPEEGDDDSDGGDEGEGEAPHTNGNAPNGNGSNGHGNGSNGH